MHEPALFPVPVQVHVIVRVGFVRCALTSTLDNVRVR